ncbi:MAG: hypothetical protein QG622_2016 [Actinomycetota bacterium]|nr:hypothetical protein [Actinomycetota bacterium]
MTREVYHPAEKPGQAPDQARVLVVVPVRDSSPPARAALDRVLASVSAGQGERADVVLVVPPSCRGLRELARARGVEVVDDPGAGTAGAVEAGVGAAGAGHRYVCWLTSDDELLPGALDVAVARLEACPDAVLAYGDCRVVTGEEEYLCTPHAAPPSSWRLLAGTPDLPRSAVLIRVAAWRDAGGLDTTLRYAMDLDLLLRLRSRGPFVPTCRTLAVFHVPARPLGAAEIAAVMAEVTSVRRRYLPPALRQASRVLDVPHRLLASRTPSVVQRAAVPSGL